MTGSNGPGGPPPPPPPGGGWQSGPPLQPARNNPMAIAALVCGIAGFLCLIPGVLGIIFGFVAKGQIRQSGGSQTGDGMATAGIVLGFVWVALTVILLAAGSVNINTN
jgi:hypothetical protein